MEEQKEMLKQDIKKWEDDFEKEKGRKPEEEDKYLNYIKEKKMLLLNCDNIRCFNSVPFPGFLVSVFIIVVYSHPMSLWFFGLAGIILEILS